MIYCVAIVQGKQNAVSKKEFQLLHYGFSSGFDSDQFLIVDDFHF